MPNCPYCHRDIEPQVTLRKPRGVTRFTSTFTDYLRGRKRDRYDHSVAQPWQGVREPQAPARQLGAGETVYRPFSWHHDIGPQLAFAGVYGGFVTVAAGAVAVGVWPACGVVLAVDAVVCGVFTWLRWDVWRREDTHPVAQTRKAENVAPQPGGLWQAESIVKEGGKTTIDRPEFSDPMAWHRFCKAVIGGREFSQSESRRHKVPPSDWKGVYDKWVDRGWLIPQGRRKPPLRMAVANTHIRNYANNPPTDRNAL